MATLTVPEQAGPSTSARPSSGRTLFVVSIGIVALIVAAVLAVGVIPSNDVVQVVSIAVGAALAATLVGAAALRSVRRRSIGVQSGVLALASVLGVAIGTLGAANAMFLSNHDERVLLVVLSSGVIAALAGSVVLGRRINRCTEQLIDATRDIGAAGSPGSVEHEHPGELARLAGELQETSQRLRDQQSQTHALEQSRKDLIVWVSGDLQKVIGDIEAMADSATAPSPQLLEDVARMRRLVDDLSALYGAEVTERATAPKA